MLFATWVLLAAACSVQAAYRHVLPMADDRLGAGFASSVPRSVAMPRRLAQASQEELQRARRAVDAVADEVATRNAARLANPARNHYRHGPRGSAASAADMPPRLFRVTDEIATAAALVAEADVFAAEGGGGLGVNASSTGNATAWKRSQQASLEGDAGAASSGYWLGRTEHVGSWPWAGAAANYSVFRDVTAYGAVGDGRTDDTAAIKKAIADGKSCTGACYSSTTKGAIIYFPAGTYLISSTIEVSFGMQVIGDAINPPTLVSAKNFIGLGILSTDHYWGDGKKGDDKLDHEYFINTANFYRQIRNFVFDTTKTIRPPDMAAVHYQVAQATSLQFVKFVCSTAAKNKQVAIFAENGSGGHMSDLAFTGGQLGISGGNQQFTAQRMTFSGVRIPVQLIWDWGWTWQSISITGADIGFNITGSSGGGSVGSIGLVDAIFQDTAVAIAIRGASGKDGQDGKNGKNGSSTGISLDNVVFDNTKTWLRTLDPVTGSVSDSNTSGRKAVDAWTMGSAFDGDAKTIKGRAPHKRADTHDATVMRSVQLTSSDNPHRLPKDPFFVRPKPQYTDLQPGNILHLRLVCQGDGVSDDTACFQQALNNNANRKVIFVDAGTYLLTDTVVVPPGTRLVGENWAQLAATGPKFQDPKEPRPMLRVGSVDQIGTVEMQDLLFTTKGPTPGVVLIEWNLEANTAGAAGMWDCHARIGGATGTGLTSKECPPATSGIDAGCNGGSMMMHLTKKASAYLENVWLWVADHDLDDPDINSNTNAMVQTSVYVARGFLIESTKPTWLYATASEHSVYYQFQFFQASTVVGGLLQTEQPYYQPTPPPPKPYENAVGSFNGDPAFACNTTQPCDAGWALRMVGSEDITVFGAGFYSWFKTYSEDCVDTMDCQATMVQMADNGAGIRLSNLVTIGATNIVDADGKLIAAKDHLSVDAHPYWTHLAVLMPKSGDSRGGGGNGLPFPIAGGVKGVNNTDDIDGLVSKIEAHLDQDCYIFPDCVDTDNPQVSTCKPGYSRMGWDRNGCGKPGDHVGLPICCKTATAPTSCTWRGGGLDCNGQCHGGEATLFKSGCGGSPTESNDKQCNRGYKFFCCTYDEMPNLTRNCRWTSCGQSCDLTESDLAFTDSLDTGGCGSFTRGQHYCCKYKPPLSNCHWVGKGDCADNTCNNHEVTLITNSADDHGNKCSWWRKKSLCCTPNPDLSEFYCDKDLCSLSPDTCPSDSYYADDGPEDDPDDDRWPPAPDDPGDDHDELWVMPPGSFRPPGSVSARTADAPDKNERRPFQAVDVTGLIIFLFARLYPGPSTLLSGRNGQHAHQFGYRQTTGACSSTDIEQVPMTPTSNFNGFQNDHTIDLQYLKYFLTAVLTGRLPSGTRMLTPTTPGSDLEHYWDYHSTNLQAGMPRCAPHTTKDFLNINERLFEVMGSKTNRAPFRLLESSLNGLKGNLFVVYDDGTRPNPVEIDRMMGYLADSIRNGSGEELWLEPLRRVIAVFRYIHDPNVLPTIQATRTRLRVQIEAIAQQANSLRNLLSAFDEFDPDYWQAAVTWARQWVRDMILEATHRFESEDPRPANADRVFNELAILLEELEYITTLPPAPPPPP